MHQRENIKAKNLKAYNTWNHIINNLKNENLGI